MRWLMASALLPRTAALLDWVLMSAGLLLGGCSGTDDEPGANSSSAPIAEQVSDAVHDQIAAAGPDLAALQAVVVVQDGETVFEEYYGTTAERYLDTESVTKSFCISLRVSVYFTARVFAMLKSFRLSYISAVSCSSVVGGLNSQAARWYLQSIQASW